MSMTRSVYDWLNGGFCNSEGMFGQNLTAGAERLLTWVVRCRNQLLDMKDIFLCFSVFTALRVAVILCCQSEMDTPTGLLIWPSGKEILYCFR